MPYCYRAYGVGIDSSVPIEGLDQVSPEKGFFNVQLEAGPEPHWVRHAKSLPSRVRTHLPEDKSVGDPAFVLTEFGDGQFYELFYSDGARFVATHNAERVWASISPSLAPEDMPLYFLGPVMGFLLRLRHITCLHASAVELNHFAVLFCGPAGAGKSTTAAAMALRGAPVLAEDIMPLELTKAGYFAVPGYRRVCLWPEAVGKILGHPDALPKLSPNWDKCYLPLDGTKAKFARSKIPIAMIYLFGDRSDTADAPRIEKISPREALLGLVQNTYMNWLLDTKQRAVEFDELGQLVLQVAVRRIVAADDPKKIPTLCDLIFADARTLPVNS